MVEIALRLRVRYCHARDDHPRSADEQVRKLRRGRGLAALEGGCVAGSDFVAGARTDRRRMGDEGEDPNAANDPEEEAKSEATTGRKKAVGLITVHPNIRYEPSREVVRCLPTL